MIQLAMDVQVVLLAVVLLVASAPKLLIREQGRRRRYTPVPSTTRWAVLRARCSVFESPSRSMTVGVGLFEGALGIALLVAPHISVRVTATLLFAVATWLVVELRELCPEAGCGCFGALSREPIGKRDIARPVFLTACAAASLGAAEAGIDVLAGAQAPVIALLAAELAVFAALSPELAALFRRRPPVPCDRRRSPLAESLEKLGDSDPWRRHRRMLTTPEPADVWREGCWRFLVFPGRLDDQPVEVVFAVSTGQRDRTVRGTVLGLRPESRPGEDSDDTGVHELRDGQDREDSGPQTLFAMN